MESAQTSAPAHHRTHVPGIFGGDLPEQEQLALDEGHDADIPTKADAERSNHDALKKESTIDSEKPEKHDTSSNNSEDGDRDIEKAADTKTTEEETTEEVDPNIVDWEGPDDPANPQNWSVALKWSNIAILSFLTLLTPLASSMFAPGVPDVIKEFDSHNDSLATFVVSVYILGFAMGPLVIAPLSEIIGRVPVYNACNVAFVLFTIACALAPNMGSLIAFRFFAGCFGIAPVTNGAGTIADMVKKEKRGQAMSVWAMGPLLGPVIGPVCGGFLAEAKGWRWIFWVLAMCSGVATIATMIFARESYAPVLLERKAKKLRKETGNPNLVSKLDSGTSAAVFWKRALLRPMKLMFLSLICALMNIYMAVVYGIMYLLFTTFTFVFEENYGFSQSIVGLVYIGLGVGMLLGLFVLGATSDPLMKKLAVKHNDGKLKPEYRLPLLVYAGPFIPVGLFIYGWAAQYQVQWAVPIIGTMFVGVGLLASFMCINTYLVDAFERYAASAMAANTILRSLFGAVFPLFGLQMYGALGLGWGNSLLAFLSIALCAIPPLFYIYGERIRTAPRFQVSL